MQLLVWDQIQYDWCPYKKGNFLHRDRQICIDVNKIRRKQTSTGQKTTRLPETKREVRHRLFSSAFRGSMAIPMP